MARLSELGVDFQHWCFACGRLNPGGMHLDFEVSRDRAEASYTARQEHQGYDGVLHGGVVTAIAFSPNGAQVITGCDDKIARFFDTNSGALVNRMNFSLTLASDRLPGVTVDSLQSKVDSETLMRAILGDDVSETTRSTVAKATSAPQMAALALGAPEFQRR